MRSRPLFELSVVGVFPQLFYFCITFIGSQAAYRRFSYEFNISFFTFLNQLLHEIFCLVYMTYLYSIVLQCAQP
jgi:hypothetical protein